MNKMKYCCEWFRINHSLPREKGLNIRIVKYSPKELMDEKNLFRYYISYAYIKEDKNVPNLNIKFCPFCGTNLYKFYKSDDYINETPGNF